MDGQRKKDKIAVLHFYDGRTEERFVEFASDRAFLDRSSLPAGIEFIDFLPEFCSMPVGSPGFYLYPGGKDRQELLTRFIPRSGTESVFSGMCIPFYACCSGEHAFLAVMTGMTLHAEIVAGIRDGVYYLYPRFRFDADGAYENPEVLFLKVEEDRSPSAVARRYRRYQLERGACKSLKERARRYPVLAEAARGPEVRIRLAWKPVPSPVPHQTEENEPPIHVALTFAQVEEIIDEFHRQKIEHAEFCLVGWNKSGHDGRFPDLFPVEPLLGGETALRQLIRKARDYGYLITGHTNLVDSYTIARRLREEFLLIQQDGSKRIFGTWGGGAAYYLCPRMAHEKYALEDLPDLRDLGFHGIQYYDVMTSRVPEPCFDPRHPLSRKAAGQWRGKTLALARELLGGSGSEGGLDFCVGDFDYVLYVMSAYRNPRPAIADEEFPFWFLVYHGILLYNAFCSTVNAMVKKDPERELEVWETGSRPLAYFYSRFMADGNDWMGLEDLRFDNHTQLEQCVARIRGNYERYRELAPLQFEFIHSWESPEEGVSEVVYENGTRLLVNRTGGVWNGVPPRSFRLENASSDSALDKHEKGMYHVSKQALKPDEDKDTHDGNGKNQCLF